MLHTEDQTNRLALLKASRREFLKRFAREDDGGIIVMTLLLLIVMLVLGGMAVDFMRFESRRALLQSVSDRAVLAAAELDQTKDPKEVVRDFFSKAGFPDTIIGEPFAQTLGGSRTVRVDSEIDVNTFYLRLIGIDTLTAPASSAAVEGTGNVEVSLILDISGSMGNWVSSENATKMELLQGAAKGFIDDLLLVDYRDQISVNLVAYSQHVSLGDELYKAINTTPDTIAENGAIGSSYAVREDGDDGTIGTGRTFTNPARCIDFDPSDYSTLTFDENRVYQQVEYFQHYNSNRRTINFPVCPAETFEGIIPLSQDAEALKAAIDLYRPTSFTSIHLGLKWGLLLLDPSMRGTLDKINSIDDAFQGERPADYTSGNTVKYVVLMTDGENVRGYRLRRDNTYHLYDTIEEQERWAEYPMEWWRRNLGGYVSTSSLVYYPTTAALHDQWMQSLCTLAKAEMTIFTIAMGSTAHGEQEMLECASQPSFAYSTNFTNDANESGIDEIFEKIARQITALRLNL